MSLTVVEPTAATATAAPVARRRRRGDRSRAASIAYHAVMITASAAAIFPVLWILYMSFGDADAWANPGEILSNPVLSNYANVLRQPDGFPTWLANSLILAAGTTVVGVLIAASAGYALSRMRFPGHGPLMWSFLITQMFPVAILIVPLYNILSALHLINTYAGLVLTYCTISVPFCAWMLRGYFDTIPAEIDEAGRLDGLSPFGTFWRLVVPLAKPGLAVTAFYTFLTAWGEVAYATQFMTTPDKYTLAVGLQTYVGQFKAEWGAMTAASVMISMVAAAVFFLVQRHLVSGLTAGAGKS
ncbi:sugar ABC transporter permease [Winogradskya humida]|uniref:ABC transporter permease n=1 Tax=Winogradskya humida TaxID=113566 RepID=A0ABQ4A7E2_9ACTN|nr:carbohydrate ABC transporter permease [Actinoplanes humidus]GIE26790.1 ABC transporter permease [Actinoplanes humidus]